MNNNYKLVSLKKEYLKILYDWNIKEKHFEMYTCRPLSPQKPYDEYFKNTIDLIDSRKVKIYVLVKNSNPEIPLSKITLFDYNSRNHSAEFGYYMPEYNRSKGLGSITLENFLSVSFENKIYNLNKLYATTSSNNNASIRLLEKFNFKLDGKAREHYWIGENKFDQCIFSLLKSEWKRQ